MAPEPESVGKTGIALVPDLREGRSPKDGRRLSRSVAVSRPERSIHVETISLCLTSFQILKADLNSGADTHHRNRKVKAVRKKEHRSVTFRSEFHFQDCT